MDRAPWWPVAKFGEQMSDLLCLGEPLYELNAQPDGTFNLRLGGDVSDAAKTANHGIALSTLGYGAVVPIPFRNTLETSKELQHEY